VPRKLFVGKKRLIQQRRHQICEKMNFDEVVKSPFPDDFGKNSACKAREYCGMRRSYSYAVVTKDESQRSRRTFYEIVNFDDFNAGKQEVEK